MSTFQSPPTYTHETPSNIGVLLVNLGTPNAPTVGAVRRYLAEFLSDRRIVELPRAIWWPILYGLILPTRPRRSAKLYQKIWLGEQGSPLLHHSTQLVQSLKAACAEQYQGQPFSVHCELAMRYGQPSVASALAALAQKNVRDLLVIPLFPQYSATTSASVFDAVTTYYQQQRWLPQMQFVSGYHDNPEYIRALANSIQAHWQQHPRGDKLLFSFHGIPKRNFDKGDPYSCYCYKTARLVAQSLSLPATEWQVVFQSRFGAQPWLQPYCDETLRQLASEGSKRVDVICPGFAVDCLETLEEMQITNGKLFKLAGGEELQYIPALNATENHVAVFMDLITRHLQSWCFAKSEQQCVAPACD